MTSSGRLIPEIDGLRFIAIGLVLLFHVNGFVKEKMSIDESTFSIFDNILNTIFEHGFLGVQIFFTISGFILALPFASHHLLNERKPVLKSYFIRRVTRLEPPYIIVMVFRFCLFLILGKIFLAVDFPHLIASLTYSHNLIYSEPSTLLFPAWSLEIEVQFYILAPLLARVFMIRPQIVRRIIITGFIFGFAFLCGIYQLIPSKESLHGLTLLSQIHYFLIGFLLCDLYLTHWKSLRGRSFFMDVVGIMGWCGLIAVAAFEWHQFVLVPICIAAGFFGGFRGRVHKSFLTFRPIVVIGGMCYTIYLWHGTVKASFGRVSTQFMIGDSYAINALIQIGAISICIIVVSAVLFALFERPFMQRNWVQRMNSKIQRHKTFKS